MAGSFDVFRRYQRSALAALAIMAMLAFFILPPFLQMNAGGGGRDPVVAAWSGGEIRESGIERAVAMRAALNRFLAEAAMAAGRDPSRIGLLPVDERSIVRTTLLAREAEANGIAISDGAVNDFLGQWTGNVVKKDAFDRIIEGLRVGPMAVSQYDLFESLRTVLAADSMQRLFQTGGSGEPPGLRWDYFRALEQSATVEIVPVVAESFAAEVTAPTEDVLRSFFERYKDALPEARSPDPGFREPHRAKVEFLVAKFDAFESEAAKGVTDEAIAAFYEKNKITMFRTKQAEKPAADTVEKPAEKPADDGSREPAAKDPEAGPPESEKRETPSKPEAAPSGGAAKDSRRRVAPVSFKQPGSSKSDGESQEKPSDKPAAGTGAPSAGGATEGNKPVADAAAEPAGKAAAEAQGDFEPLDKVRDEIRKRLAREAAESRIDGIFSAVAGDMTRYAEDLALWQARQRTSGVEAPRPPDFKAIASKQGLEAGDSKLVTEDQAVGIGPIGGSFEIVADPASRFGFRQQRWLDMIFGEAAPTLRPVTSRDVGGDRFISWKTEDQPEFTPTFQTAREDVERSWRIVEARSIARRKAEEIVTRAKSAGGTLADAVADRPGLAAVTVGPFTWLSQGTVSPGLTPTLSQPDGVSMPGEDFMRAVFGLESGETAAVFNEPRTVCYVVRLVSYEPTTERLQERFIAERQDQRRIGMVARRDLAATVTAWSDGLDQRYGLSWKREPR